jgi:hypothetical protein
MVDANPMSVALEAITRDIQEMQLIEIFRLR